MSSAIDHDQAQAEFSDFVDGALSAEARAALEAHLAGCEPCRGELEVFRKTLEALRGGAPAAAAEGPSPAFMDSLKAQINTRSRGRFFGQRRRSYRLEIVSLLTLLVAATIYVALTMAQPLWLVR